MDNKLSDLTIIIVTFKTNISILKDCLNCQDEIIKFIKGNIDAMPTVSKIEAVIAKKESL